MNYFTFGPCEKFEDIRLIAPSKAISCLNSGLIFRVLLKIVWNQIEINYKTLGTAGHKKGKKKGKDEKDDGFSCYFREERE